MSPYAIMSLVVAMSICMHRVLCNCTMKTLYKTGSKYHLENNHESKTKYVILTKVLPKLLPDTNLVSCIQIKLRFSFFYKYKTICTPPGGKFYNYSSSAGLPPQLLGTQNY